MKTRFTGKVVLVTGGGSGIGRALARSFAGEGATVVVAGRSQDTLDQTVKIITTAGGRAHAVQADVTRSEDMARVVRATFERFDGLHIAVNNAGVLDAVGPVPDVGETGWARVVEVNLTGVYLSMKHEIAHMREAGGGCIVNMSSVIGPHVTLPMLAAYAASKAAVSSLTRTAAREAIQYGVRVNAVSPGPSDTPMSLQPGETETARAERLRTQLPIGRVGSLDEIAAAVLFLASAEAAFVVGHDLVVDGGLSA
ncbi:SDR family NAD(P)-dependent oxidoreductase [Nonomuraea typhae]|uniref:SDR family NAD(P)-dependent oxidoreductase n=1 Tax=Nonomuraea typhae TaxID=2603600 RepID=A0ABW7YQ37_9ACTN